MFSEKRVKGIPGFRQFPLNQQNHRQTKLCVLRRLPLEYVLILNVSQSHKTLLYLFKDKKKITFVLFHIFHFLNSTVVKSRNTLNEFSYKNRK